MQRMACVECAASRAANNHLSPVRLYWSRRKQYGWTYKELYNQYGEPRQRTDGGRPGKRGKGMSEARRVAAFFSSARVLITLRLLRQALVSSPE